ncbi:protein TPX2 [Coffea arabica]|uniref:Protein TPX2 n=1 Tax=Coffea arabica TaxID=13443 RepID=A0A6P6SCV2_COFAR|nr:protein TPX2-like [Coffea arabica]
MAVAEDPNGNNTSEAYMIDEAYEFRAPKFYDFIDGETQEDMKKAELWFETACSYAPSPFMPRIKAGRSVQLASICDFNEGENLHKALESSESTATCSTAKESTLELESQIRPQAAGELRASDVKNVNPNELKEEPTRSLTSAELDGKESSVPVGGEVSTPAPPTNSGRNKSQKTDSKKQQTARKIASMLKNPPALKSKYQSQQSQSRSSKPASVRKDTNVKSTVETPNFAQENQAVKRQKLEGGKSRQILNVKLQNLPHKTRNGLVSSSSNLCLSTAKTSKENRKLYVREPAIPFVSMAEMMKKFQSNTREISLPPRSSSSLSHDSAARTLQRKPKLTLTRPKEPEFETAQRARPVRVKSSAELEEEMMAKVPKFKARPLNKKILETPTLPKLPRTTPQLPEFKEFHLETMARANQNAETSTVASIESSQAFESYLRKPHLTAPKSPLLQTSLRARPPKIKSSDELEEEEVEKVPKFKARPLNRKIFESKGELGMFCNTKRQVTMPQEFHFATDERIPPPTNVADMFDKLSINSERQQDKPIPRNTTPNPFHLHTEERGAEKEKKLVSEFLQKQWEEEWARIPKALPYPYTTDYPVIPPKPEPKPCTRPEPFELESLVRHEEEIQREMEERQQRETEEAQMRIFKAQPILREDPIPVPEKARKPLTEVQTFNLHVDHRAVDRAEFDKKVKEKEMMYKRYREEAESERLMEEEKALKQLRRTLVPHARPVPNFEHPFLPQKSSKQVTKPKSPRLNILKRKEKRRMVCPVPATASSLPTQMR